MLPKTKKKLSNLVKTGGWSHIIIRHDQEGVRSLGIHEIYGNNDDEHQGVSWSATPIIVADNYDALYEVVENLHQLVCCTNMDFVTEKELEDFNQQPQEKEKEPELPTGPVYGVLTE